MLQPVRMSKVRAICLKTIAPSVIKMLHNLSVLHLKDAQVPQTQRAGPLPSYDDVSSRLIRIRSMREALQKGGKIPKKRLQFENLLSEADGMLEEEGKLRSLLHEKEEVAKELDALSSSRKALADLVGLDVDFSALHSDSLQFVLLKASPEKARQATAAVCRKKNYAITEAKSDKGGSVLLVALPKSDDAKFLEQFGQLLPLPAIEGTARQETGRMRAAEDALQKKLGDAQAKLQKFSEKNSPMLIAVQEALEIEADRAQAATQFAGTDSLYIIEGWVEKRKFARLEETLKKEFGRKILVCEAPIDEHHDVPPTLLSNPKQAGPFQFLVEFLSTTHYNELDPTLLVAFFIPVIYAMILGDAGYAILSLVISLYLIKISKRGSLLNQVAKIWAISAIPAFVVGVAFDEWFGFTHEHLLAKLGMEHMSFYQAALHRVHSIEMLMLFVIIVGAIHLGLGFLLGAINEWTHSKKHAIAKLSWLGIEIGGFFTVAAFMFGAFPALSLPALALLGVSIITLIATEGIIGAFEIPGLASNIMSYIRIAAVGVGGVILAEAINELLFPHFELTPMGILVFLLTAIAYLAIHMISCTIAMFESFIHGARLNVVEFFGKFYKGNGVRFSPFAARRLYTEES